MEKINGYERCEAEELTEYIEKGRKEGKTLTSLFFGYGKEHGRAAGSVRNYYYKLLKTDSEAAQSVLKGKSLKAEKIAPFTEQEKQEMLRQILNEKKKGMSVRRAIFTVCGGDAKKILRYQNKYRNMLKNQPEQIRAAAEKAGLPADSVVKRREKSFLEKRLESEINALYDRLAFSLREENRQLRETVRRLTEENELLRRASRVKKAMLASSQPNVQER